MGEPVAHELTPYELISRLTLERDALELALKAADENGKGWFRDFEQAIARAVRAERERDAYRDVVDAARAGWETYRAWLADPEVASQRMFAAWHAIGVAVDALPEAGP